MTVAALLMPNEILSMSAQAARRIIGAGSGDCALLYLALLDCGGDERRARAALKQKLETEGYSHEMGRI